MTAAAPWDPTKLPRKRTAAGVLLRDRTDRVLLVEPTYKDTWEIPGGVVEDDESPRAAVVRELAEELELAVEPGRLLVVDYVAAHADHSDGVMFVFDGGVLDDTAAAGIRLPADELRSWAWCTLDEADERLSGLLAPRVRAATVAGAERTTLYLENGRL